MSASNDLLLAMSAPPYWHCGRTLRKINLHILLALVPAMIFSVVNWGLPALRVMVLASSFAVLTEVFWRRIMKRLIRVDDLSACVSGLLFSFLLPADAPIWLVLLGSFLAISLGKIVFGNLGGNPLNTALTGWAILAVSFPGLMDPNTVQLATSWADPLVVFRSQGLQAMGQFSIVDLLLGHQVSALGAGQVGALLVGGLYLTMKGFVRWPVVLGFFLGVGAVAGLFQYLEPDQAMPPLLHLLTGSVVFGAFFLAPDPATSPLRKLCMLLYGLLAGGLAICIRRYGVWVDGVPFAILLANLVTPWFDLIRPRPFGGKP